MSQTQQNTPQLVYIHSSVPHLKQRTLIWAPGLKALGLKMVQAAQPGVTYAVLSSSTCAAVIEGCKQQLQVAGCKSAILTTEDWITACVSSRQLLSTSPYAITWPVSQNADALSEPPAKRQRTSTLQDPLVCPATSRALSSQRSAHQELSPPAASAHEGRTQLSSNARLHFRPFALPAAEVHDRVKLGQQIHRKFVSVSNLQQQNRVETVTPHAPIQSYRTTAQSHPNLTCGVAAIKVITYNVLSDAFGSKSASMTSSSAEHRSWAYRGPRLLVELAGYDADLLCLQEVDRPLYHTELLPWARSHGYECMYLSRDYARGSQAVVEGVALLYRSDKFEKVASRAVRFKDCVPPDAKGHMWTSVSHHLEGCIMALLRVRHHVEHHELGETDTVAESGRSPSVSKPPASAGAVGQLYASSVAASSAAHTAGQQHICDTSVASTHVMQSVEAISSPLPDSTPHDQGPGQASSSVPVGKLSCSDITRHQSQMRILHSRLQSTINDDESGADVPANPALVLPTDSHIQHNAAGPLICVAATHLWYDPRWPDVKVAQAHLLCQQVSSFLHDHGHADPSSVPCIIAGDFNSTWTRYSSDAFDHVPNGTSLTSGVYQLLATGQLDSTHPHHPARRNRPTPDVLAQAALRFHTAGLKLQSAYLQGTGREPPVTNKNKSFAGCLDYIWLSPQHWHVESLLQLPYNYPADPQQDEHSPELRRFPDIPNKNWPSDHLALGAVLRLRPEG